MNQTDTIDELKGLDIRLIQPAVGPRVNVDTILLAGFTKVRKDEKICELGCAHGAVSLILAKRSRVPVIGVDIQGHLVEMAGKNAELNGLDGNASFIEGDIRNIGDIFSSQIFDVVVSNPPYGDPSRHRRGKRETESLARHGEACSVDDISRACRHLLGDGGRAYLIFTAERMVELISSMKSAGVEPKAMRPVYPRENRDGTVFLLKAIRGASPGMRLLPPLFIGSAGFKSTDELLRYYTVEGCPCP